jgi:DNA-binding NtrC family response regulator
VMETEAIEYLQEKPWRGNVRELENLVSRACILSNCAVIKLTHVRDIDSACESVMSCGSVREMETKLILEALKSVRGNRTKAASTLGITVRTLRNKINEYKTMGIDVPIKEY